MTVRVFESARAVTGALGGRPKYLLSLVASVPAEKWKAFKGRKVVDELQFLRMIHPFWLTYQKFVFRPRFRRAWVTQECALARELSLLIGHQEVGPGFLSTVINRLVWQEPSNRCSVIHDAYLVNPFNLLHPFVALSTFSLAKIMPCIGTRHETSCVPSSSR